MIKIIFNSVGQGDSIILEWEKEHKNKVAIIDCNLFQNSNPTLNYIIQNQVTEIEYLILTHPHYDHFSGFYELLNYCKTHSIQVKYFLHTCSSIPEYLKTAVKSMQATKELAKLFHFIHKNFELMGFKVGTISADLVVPMIPLNEDVNITVLSPSHVEEKKYIANTNFQNQVNDPNNNPHANYLSTLLKIQTPKGYILLTSDYPKDSFKRVDTKTKYLEGETLILGQSPHHGALRNHSNIFWKKRKKENACPIVFSVGVNQYGHPSPQVIDFFSKNNYIVHSTHNSFIHENTKILDIFSQKICSNGDNAFLTSDF